MSYSEAAYITLKEIFELFKILMPYISPFIAAFIASWLTYYFTLRSKRADLLFQHRIDAFKKVAKKLSNIKKQFIFNITQMQGIEIGPDESFLEDGKNKATRIHTIDLISIQEENQIFLTDKSRKYLETLVNNLMHICGMELGINENPDLKESYIKAYNVRIEEIDKCLKILFSELKIPKH